MTITDPWHPLAEEEHDDILGWHKPLDWPRPLAARRRPASRERVAEYWRVEPARVPQPMVVFGSKIGANDDTRRLFGRMVEQWRTDTMALSSVREMCTNVHYQQIIGLGAAAIPLIMSDLAEGGGVWAWALTAITREDPTDGSATSPYEADQAWLAWGRDRGYLDDSVSAA